MNPQKQRVERRLAAILAADVAGYSRLMEADEVGTLRILTAHRAIMDGLISENGGRIANTAGDSLLAEFPSAVDAVQCAVEIQERLGLEPGSQSLRFRIGVHVGDVMVRDGDLLGDGVNVAARLQELAPPGSICVSETAYHYVRKLLPLSFSDLGPQRVKNMEEPVRAYSLKPGPVASTSSDHAKPLSLPDRPSIAVLPFANLSEDPQQEYFADGLVEDIITGLSRVRSFFVIARNSSFTYKGRAVDVRQVSRELGVQYVLEGSIRKAGSRVRIAGQLIDGMTGHHVWADRFDGDMSDIFELQDRVTESVVGAVEPSIRLEEIRQAHNKPTTSVTAYDLYLRALPCFYKMTREGFADVRRLTNEALSIDPGFTLAKALGAYIRSISVSQCWHEPDDIRVAIRMAREVMSEARDDPTSLRFAAQVLAYSAKDYEAALNAIERSLSLNPNSAQSYTSSGWVNTHASRPLVAIDHFHKAMRLSPLDPEKGIALSGIGMCYLMLEQFEEALNWGEIALREMPGYGSSYRVVIGALVGLGRLDEAKMAAERLMEAFPTYTLSLQRQINPWRDQTFAQRYLDALQAAGIPE
ncbi:adenylate/guanylate cyclase domain-containing protein [Microvirga lotononidis]|uniref:Putative integral membrane protein n=1 Tax=Microvirga lotononidis TaxID=864069 RepID=I4YYR9_9HYPH|nr:adenylate/guanylate cyclase domain-containing protein [Microvirga lotononidis]EIM29111.1 putative integral membrane protein [Microvirga lotononidis]WQO28956.1 adenylate/guanylate cyclase domain-containing protein [Microvirga lotononidis]